MRKVTRNAVAAFLAGNSYSEGNTSTDGSALYLHGNRIAWKEGEPDSRLFLWLGNADDNRRDKRALAAADLNPDNGYLYGNAWKFEAVPEDVMEFLRSLPESPVRLPVTWDRP